MTLEGFVVEADTTGGDLLDGVSQTEASCVSDQAGDAFQSIVDTVLLEGGSDLAVAEPMAICLTEENFVVYSTAIISAKVGAERVETSGCITDLGRASPALAYITFGVLEEYTGTYDPNVLRPFTRDFYECFSVSEKVELTVLILDHIATTASITGRQFLDAMGDDVIDCYTDVLGISRDQFEVVVETTFAAGTASTAQAPDCLTNDTLAEILVTLSVALAGRLSDETVGCLRTFGLENPEYLELMAIGDFDPAAMTEAEFVEIAEVGIDIFDCYTNAEFLPVQLVFIDMMT